MKFMKRLTLALMIALMAVPFTLVPAAATQSAKEYLESIYWQYRSEDGKQTQGIYLDNDAAIRQYFDAPLATLIINDNIAAKKSGDVPSLDGDPFVGAQEWSIKSFNILMRGESANRADADVSFKNFDKDVKIQASLIRTPDGWRFSDIVWDGKQGSLSGLYKK